MHFRVGRRKKRWQDLTNGEKRSVYLFALILLAIFGGMIYLPYHEYQEEERIIDAEIKPLMVVDDGNTEAVTALAFSPDGAMLASGGKDGVLKLLDARTGAALRSLTSHIGAINSLTFSPDGKIIVSGGDDKLVRLWDVASGTPLGAFAGHTAAIFSVAYSRDGKTIASLSRDNSLKLRDAGSGAVTREFEVPVKFVDAALNPDLSLLVTAGETRDPINLWDVRTGKLIRPMEAVEYGNRVTFSPDGTTIVGDTSRYGHLMFWDARTGKEIRSFGYRSGSIILFSPDGKKLAVAGQLIELCDLMRSDPAWTTFHHGTETPHLTGITKEGFPTALAFSPDGHVLASGGSDHRIKLWDATRSQTGVTQ